MVPGGGIVFRECEFEDAVEVAVGVEADVVAEGVAGVGRRGSLPVVVVFSTALAPPRPFAVALHSPLAPLWCNHETSTPVKLSIARESTDQQRLLSIVRRHIPEDVAQISLVVFAGTMRYSRGRL